MKRKSKFNTICGLASCILASLILMNEAKADGDDTLGTPSIEIAEGSYIMAEGTGLKDLQPGNITIDIPGDASIAQVLLYWGGRSTEEILGDFDTIQVNGMPVTGLLIGVSLEGWGFPSHTYRADITPLNLVAAGENVLSVSGLNFSHINSGAAVVVILDDGSTTDIQIMDGDDFAWEPQSTETEPITFPIEPSDDARAGTMWFILSDIDYPRPAAVDVSVDGITNRYDLTSNKGAFLDVVEVMVSVPAGASNVTAQAVSINDGSEAADPASLVWSFVSWSIGEGCTYTQGYWKNHPENWPTDVLSLGLTGDTAMDILWTKPKGGNAYIILAHQYIAAELNMENGASIPENVGLAWLVAQDLLLKYESEGDIDKKKEASDRAWAIDLANMLDDYNNGVIGPGHCD